MSQWIRNQILEDQLWNMDIFSTSSDQHDQTQMSYDSNLEILNDQFSIAQQFCSCDSTSTDIDEQSEISRAGMHIKESLLPRNPSPEPQSTFKTSNVIVISGEQNTGTDSQKSDASTAAQLKENCQEIRKSNFATAETMEVNQNMNCRVLID